MTVIDWLEWILATEKVLEERNTAEHDTNSLNFISNKNNYDLKY